ncbi:MAG: glycosyltransferase [Verrucomicrobia bacterium]|nr:glycosyltransferase [Verrucomicrobiota bacterium]
MASTGNWLAATPLPYGENLTHWERDAGLTCLGLRELGQDARLVAQGTPAVRTDPPLILGSLRDFQNPEWWRRTRAEGVILTAGGAPRYAPIAHAIRDAGLRLIVRLDSDGYKSPRTGFRRFLAWQHCYYRDQGKPFPQLLALAKALVFRGFKSAHDAGLCAHLEHAEVITIESPGAREVLCQLLRFLDRLDLADRVRFVPHPVPDYFRYDSARARRKQLLAAGRWDSYFKDTPKLARVLGEVLSRDPECSAVVAGSRDDLMRAELARLPQEVTRRVQVLGYVRHGELLTLLQESQAVLCTSRSESFHLVAAQGLCCGCSVVGPAELPSFVYFASQDSGTVAPDRSDSAMVTAAQAELSAWAAGRRSPASISAIWRAQLTARAMAGELMRLAGEVAGRRV